MRTHYVYRMYDATERLLYVGCTKNLEQRFRNHKNENPHFIGRVTRIKQQGPFPKAQAFALEKRLIRELRPDFNSLPDRRQRLREKRNWITDRTFELCGGRHPTEVEVNEYLRLSKVAYDEASQVFPGVFDSRSPHPAESATPVSAPSA